MSYLIRGQPLELLVNQLERLDYESLVCLRQAYKVIDGYCENLPAFKKIVRRKKGPRCIYTRTEPWDDDCRFYGSIALRISIELPQRSEIEGDQWMTINFGGLRNTANAFLIDPHPKGDYAFEKQILKVQPGGEWTWYYSESCLIGRPLYKFRTSTFQRLLRGLMETRWHTIRHEYDDGHCENYPLFAAS
jgi:hypothetical protein